MSNGHSARWDDGITGIARNIALSDNTTLKVLAGPGTGKTFALKRRVARLIQEGTVSRSIMVCTFTRTAARDLQSELLDLGITGIEHVYAGTLHAFCNRILQS